MRGLHAMTALYPEDQAFLEAVTLREKAKAQRFLRELVNQTRSELFGPRVCANRTDTPGFFDSCNWNTKNGCLCSKQVAEELKANPHAYGADAATIAEYQTGRAS